MVWYKSVIVVLEKNGKRKKIENASLLFTTSVN